MSFTLTRSWFTSLLTVKFIPNKAAIGVTSSLSCLNCSSVILTIVWQKCFSRTTQELLVANTLVSMTVRKLLGSTHLDWRVFVFNDVTVSSTNQRVCIPRKRPAESIKCSDMRNDDVNFSESCVPRYCMHRRFNIFTRGYGSINRNLMIWAFLTIITVFPIVLLWHPMLRSSFGLT